MDDTPHTSQTDKQIPALIASLGDKNGLVRQRARLKLVHLGRVSAPPLFEALKNGNSNTRLEVVKVLGELRDPITADALTNMLLDEETSVRWAAMEGLIHLGRACLRPVLEKLVKNFDSIWMREGVHHILHVFRDRHLLNEEETFLFGKLDQKEIPGFELGWNTEAAWAAEKALEALDRAAQ